MENQKRHLLLIASEQIWPNMMGVLYAIKHLGGVNNVHILHTSDPKSQLPAQRLQNWIQSELRELECQLVPVDITPRAVSQTIRALMNERGGRWIINATGGLKLMSFGVSDLLLEGQCEPRVIYRELSRWYELKRCDGRICEEVLPEDSFLTDQMRLEVLAQMQKGGDWQIQPPLRLPLSAMAKNGVICGWDWNRIFRDADISLQIGGGNLFEYFLAGLLLEFGLSNVGIGLKAVEENFDLNEMDVLCVHRNQFIVFDCKLTDEEHSRQTGKGTLVEINDSLERLNTGGLMARGFFVRPTREVSAPHCNVADKRHLKVWDERHMPDIVPLLGEVVGRKNPEQWTPELRTVHETLQNARTRWPDRKIFSWRPETARPPLPKRTLFDLEGGADGLESSLSERGWSLFRVENYAFLLLRIPQEKRGEFRFKPVEELTDLFAKAEIQCFWCEDSGTHFNRRFLLRFRSVEQLNFLHQLFLEDQIPFLQPKT